jgi:hypothetical protein
MRFFQAQSRQGLSSRRQLFGGDNLVHGFVTPEVIDERVAGLHSMHYTVR